MQLPDVLTAIINLYTIDFDADEYDIKRRLTRLLDRWGVTRLFVDQYQHQGHVALVRIHSICEITMSFKSPFCRVLFRLLQKPEVSHANPRTNTMSHCCQVSFEMYCRNCPLSMWQHPDSRNSTHVPPLVHASTPRFICVTDLDCIAVSARVKQSRTG